jgi:hypothetical protein
MAASKHSSNARGRVSLWRTDGARYGHSAIAATADGGLEITHHDIGAADRAAWGEDDNELGVTLTPAATAEVAMALLRDRFGGRPDAATAIHAWCEANGIEAILAAWT